MMRTVHFEGIYNNDENDEFGVFNDENGVDKRFNVG